MPEQSKYDYVIRDATVIDGTGAVGYQTDLGIVGDRIAKLGDLSTVISEHQIHAQGLCLAPGFIDVHTHDDIYVLKQPQMLNKISQGVTTIIVGNCGISASPAKLTNLLPDPMNLLGSKEDFVYPRMSDYADAISETKIAINVAALAGHTSIRNNVLPQLNRSATTAEIDTMREQLADTLKNGAIGLSSGLAYESAINAKPEEVMALAEVLADYDGVYTTHLRSEFDDIVTAMEEAFVLGQRAGVPVIISHFKCAGIENWGRTSETIPYLAKTAVNQEVSCDCYPYSASSSTLDLKQITDDFDIFISWSKSYPEEAGQMLAAVAEKWQLSLQETARKLQPAGAVYHNMSEKDVQRILKYKDCMIGSDGLPNDPHPHPRLWGTFPRVLSHYCRELEIFDLHEAVRRMTGLPAEKFNLKNRGVITEGNFADLTLFDAQHIKDVASFENPKQISQGIKSVWVNGILSYEYSKPVSGGAGVLLTRN